jgi:hypothetical protein
LIWIKADLRMSLRVTAAVHRFAPMALQSRPPTQVIRHCPLCGVAMLGSKSSETSVEFDTFTCLRCQSVMVLTSSTQPGKPEDPN